MKGFSVSGHDAVLKRVLSTDFGLNVTIKGVAGADVTATAGRPGRPGTGAPGGGPPARGPAGSRPRAVGGRPAGIRRAGSPEPDDEPDDMPPGGSHEDEPSPDDRAVRNAELTGMDLIQRELGGQVIGEFEG